MKIKQLLLLMVISLIATPLLAQTAPEGGMNMAQLIIYLTPFIIYGAAETVKVVKPHITGVFLLVFIGASSGMIALVTQLAANPEYGWTGQFFLGLVVVYVNQFFKQWDSGN